MAEMICRKLGFPFRTDARLRAGHDSSVINENIGVTAPAQEAFREPADALTVGEVEFANLDAAYTFDVLSRGGDSSGSYENAPPRVGKRARSLKPKAGIAAGDNRRFSSKINA
jgi:hypothetical protein